MNKHTLTRIADALERIAEQAEKPAPVVHDSVQLDAAALNKLIDARLASRARAAARSVPGASRAKG